MNALTTRFPLKNATWIVLTASILGLACGGPEAEPASALSSEGLLSDLPEGTLSDSAETLEELEQQRVAMLNDNLEALLQLREAIQDGRVSPLEGADGHLLDLDAEIIEMQNALTNEEMRLPSIFDEGQVQAQAAATEKAYKAIIALKLSTFISKLSAYKKKYPSFNWKTDFCSMPVKGNYLGFKDRFARSCRHHDFAYHNVRKFSGLRNEVFRAYVDGRFLQDMNGQCGSDLVCKAAAVVFYNAVRIGGLNSPFYD